MTVLHSPSTVARCGWLALALLLAVAAPLTVLAESAKPTTANPAPDEATDTGFTANGELRSVEGGALTIYPWQPRLPSRLLIKVSNKTRILRQKKGSRSDLAVGELVLVVEEPPSQDEKEQLRQSAGKGKKKKKARELPVREARARAVVRYWKADHPEQDPALRQTALALLEGARPFFKGANRGGVRQPGNATRLVVGAVTDLEPFTVRTAKRTVRYSLNKNTLVVGHQPATIPSMKRGENLLVQSTAAPQPGEPVQATVVAITPKPRLKLEQQRRLILRDRKSPEGIGAGNN